MRKREIWLPDRVDEIGLAKAKQSGIDLPGLYAGLLSDILLENSRDRMKGPESAVFGAPVRFDGKAPANLQSECPAQRVAGYIEDSDGRLTDSGLNLRESEPGLFHVVGGFE